MYAEITDNTITKIVRAGGSYKNLSFGKNATEQEYLDAGLYKLIVEKPTSTEFQFFGEETILIDEATKTVTKSRQLLDKSAEDIYKIKLKNINMEYEQSIAQLTTGIPESEKGTWSKQEAEARAYIADNTTPTPLIDGIAIARNVDKTYLVDKIIEKADIYTIKIAQLIGIRQAKEDNLI